MTSYQMVLASQIILKYPALCRTIKDGGLGFDFRLSQSQTKQYLPKMLFQIPIDVLKVHEFKALVFGWLETEFAEVNVIDFVMEIKRSKYIFLLNLTKIEQLN